MSKKKDSVLDQLIKHPEKLENVIDTYDAYKEVYLYMMINHPDQLDQLTENPKKMDEAIDAYDDYIYEKQRVFLEKKEIDWYNMDKQLFTTSFVMLCLVILIGLALPESFHKPDNGIFGIILISGFVLFATSIAGICGMMGCRK